MAWNPSDDLQNLETAFQNFDREAAKAQCDELVSRIYRTAEPYPVNDAKKLLSLLRRKRCFAQMQALADAFIQSGATSNPVRRLYAQALLDQGYITAALLVLRQLVADAAASDPVENAEAMGLIGRAYKQLYVNARESTIPRNRSWLEEAAKSYYETYKSRPESFGWHGINVVAVADRSVRDHVPLRTPGLPLPTTLADEILQRIDTANDNGNATLWDYGTAAEASIALGRSREALRWTREYAGQKNADAFELASTLRQFEEVWGLPRGGNPDEEALLSLLRATILEREGGKVVQSAADLRAEVKGLAGAENLERVFGADRFQSLEWYRCGLIRCGAVARIGLERSRGVGTGFLVKGTNLHPTLGDELYLLTNSHVISPEPEAPIAIRPEDAVVTFEGLPGAEGKSWTVKKKVIFTSPIRDLDATLVQLDRPVEGAEGYPIAAEPPSRNGTERVYVVGHPLGGGLSFSLQDNLLLDWDQKKVHYRTPTEPGSSGSPVFNAQWKLIALHHAGRSDMPKLNGKPGTYEANEGINVQAIVAGIRAALGPA